MIAVGIGQPGFVYGIRYCIQKRELTMLFLAVRACAWSCIIRHKNELYGEPESSVARQAGY